MCLFSMPALNRLATASAGGILLRTIPVASRGPPNVKDQSLSLPTHLSIVWGVTLAVLTIIEWKSLDRDPVGQQILLPFIEREISVVPVTAAGDAPVKDASSALDGPVRYEVEFHFNGPLFLTSFFVPVLIFHGGGWLWARARRP